ncbi:MAG: ABC-ATPase domain-containing protein, partial [Candidatus Bathyarchaeia archaeon]
RFILFIDSVQGDPFASPSRVRTRVDQSLARFPQELYRNKVRRILAAMERRAHSVTIPRSLRLMMELMRILPDPLFSRLIGRAFAEPGEERAEPTVSARPKGDG